MHADATLEPKPLKTANPRRIETAQSRQHHARQARPSQSTDEIDS